MPLVTGLVGGLGKSWSFSKYRSILPKKHFKDKRHLEYKDKAGSASRQPKS